MHKICEFGQYSTKDKRCRKWATMAICVKRPFGEQVGPKGDIPTYVFIVTFRCDDHQDQKLGGEFFKGLSMQEYAAKGGT